MVVAAIGVLKFAGLNIFWVYTLRYILYTTHSVYYTVWR